MPKYYAVVETTVQGKDITRATLNYYSTADAAREAFRASHANRVMELSHGSMQAGYARDYKLVTVNRAIPIDFEQPAQAQQTLIASDAADKRTAVMDRGFPQFSWDATVAEFSTTLSKIKTDEAKTRVTVELPKKGADKARLEAAVGTGTLPTPVPHRDFPASYRAFAYSQAIPTEAGALVRAYAGIFDDYINPKNKVAKSIHTVVGLFATAGRKTSVVEQVVSFAWRHENDAAEAIRVHLLDKAKEVTFGASEVYEYLAAQRAELLSRKTETGAQKTNPNGSLIRRIESVMADCAQLMSSEPRLAAGAGAGAAAGAAAGATEGARDGGDLISTNPQCAR